MGVDLPEQRSDPDAVRHREAVAALDAVAPQVLRVANALRVTELHLAIAEAVHALEAGYPDLALRVLKAEQADSMPRRAREGGRRPG